MRLIDPRNDFDELVSRFFSNGEARSGENVWPSGGYNVPTDMFHADDSLVLRMELAGVDPKDVEISVQDNTLLINGTRRFPHDPEKVRFVRRGTFYGDFTQRVMLGKGLDLETISARYDNGVLVLTIPYAAQAQPRKIEIQTAETPAIDA